jgi:hypothetical protein
MDSARTDASGLDAHADEELWVATVTERPDGVTVCTISPPPSTGRALLSEWVGATEGSFVSLEAMR